MPTIDPSIKTKILDKLRSALETLRAKASADKLPSLDALRVMLNKMKPKDPDEPTKINYYGGVFKLAPKLAAAYSINKDPERKRMRLEWQAGVQAVPRPGR